MSTTTNWNKLGKYLTDRPNKIIRHRELAHVLFGRYLPTNWPKMVYAEVFYLRRMMPKLRAHLVCIQGRGYMYKTEV